MFKKANQIIMVLSLLMVCLLILFSKTFDLLIFKYQQLEIQSEVEQMIEHNSSSEKIQTLVFKAEHFDQLNWVKENKEFIYHNNRFDVVKIIQSENFIVVKCFADNREDRLFAEFEKLSKEKANHDSENKNSSENFTEDILPTILNKITSFDFSCTKELSYSSLPSYYFLSLENDSPPPRPLA